MATTLKNTKQGAKRNILSNSAIRYVGFIISFIGIMLLMVGRITSTIIQIISISLMLIGLLLVSGNIKKIIKKQKDKDTSYYLLIGILLIAISILLYVFGGQISKWLDLIVGILLALYGIVLLISFAIKKTISKAKNIFNIILSCLFVVTGILIALLFEIYSSPFMVATGIIATISGISALLTY